MAFTPLVEQFAADNLWVDQCLTPETWNQYFLKTHWRIILIGNENAGMFNHIDVLQTSSWHAHIKVYKTQTGTFFKHIQNVNYLQRQNLAKKRKPKMARKMTQFFAFFAQIDIPRADAFKVKENRKIMGLKKVPNHNFPTQKTTNIENGTENNFFCKIISQIFAVIRWAELRSPGVVGPKLKIIAKNVKIYLLRMFIGC